MEGIQKIILFAFGWFMVFFIYGGVGRNVNIRLAEIIESINVNLLCGIDPILLLLFTIFIIVIIIKYFTGLGK